MSKAFAIAVLALSLAGSAARTAEPATPVTAANFVRAETDLYIAQTVADGGFGKLNHVRQPPAIDRQTVVRMNRDTLYSMGVFDLQAGPLTVTMPEAGRRYMSLQVISQDHHTVDVAHGGTHSYTKAEVGTRYAFVIVRTLVDPRDPEDLERVHELQDAIRTEQLALGSYVPSNWDKVSQAKARQALNTLGSLGNAGERFGTKDQVDPIQHLIGAATGWGGLPSSEADYVGAFPAANDGRTVHVMELKDVPVDGFWSISVYNADGYFQKNALGAYTLNNITAERGEDGGYRIQFGGCGPSTSNCLPITPGWNYTLRLYQPRKVIRDGDWTAPEAQPVR